MLEALVAMVVLVLGLLGMSRFQARVVQAGTDGQLRMKASRIADELANLAISDVRANAPCYTMPATGTCPSTAASTATAAWKTAALAALPGSVTVTSELDANFQLTVTVVWTGKLTEKSDGVQDVLRQVQVVTNVRY